MAGIPYAWLNSDTWYSGPLFSRAPLAIMQGGHNRRVYHRHGWILMRDYCVVLHGSGLCTSGLSKTKSTEESKSRRQNRKQARTRVRARAHTHTHTHTHTHKHTHTLTHKETYRQTRQTTREREISFLLLAE